MIYHGFQGGNGFQPSRMLRLGLSFTGGTDITVQFTQPTTADNVKAALARPRPDRRIGHDRRQRAASAS